MKHRAVNYRPSFERIYLMDRKGKLCRSGFDRDYEKQCHEQRDNRKVVQGSITLSDPLQTPSYSLPWSANNVY
jgi:hypothetical protein